jgi:pyrimidine-nucleoside phosphorylase
VNIIDIIETKRDCKELAEGQIEYFVKEYCYGNVADYQAASLLMAIYINGMSEREISDLTKSMTKSRRDRKPR